MRPSIWAVWFWWIVTPWSAHRVGDQGKSLDFSLEDPDGGRPAVIDRQAELGAEVDDLAAQGESTVNPARGAGTRAVSVP